MTGKSPWDGFAYCGIPGAIRYAIAPYPSLAGIRRDKDIETVIRDYIRDEGIKLQGAIAL